MSAYKINPANHNDDGDLNPHGAVMQDDSTKKKRKLTEKGLCLKKSTDYNKRKKMYSRLLRLANAIEDQMYMYENMVTVQEEIAQCD